MKNTWVFGDIHGAGKEFRTLVSRVYKPGDRIICVGDLFDRGLDARIVWETIHEYEAICCVGNHERKMMRYLEGDIDYVPDHYHYALHELLTKGVVSKDDFQTFLASLKMLVDCSYANTIIAHGGVEFENPLIESVDANVYGRPKGEPAAWWKTWKGPQSIVYGHTVTLDGKPRIRTEFGDIVSVGIDTFVVHGGPMTCWNVEKRYYEQFQSGIDHNKAFRELRVEKFIP